MHGGSSPLWICFSFFFLSYNPSLCFCFFHFLFFFMSIALNTIDVAPSASFMHGAAAMSMSMSFGLIFESLPPEVSPPAGEETVASSSSLSIGKNSDVSSEEEGDEENDEAQSSYKGPLDMMEALEEVLPIRRGISKFYNYKSKSFTSLAEAATSSSIKEIAKPDNAYTRKRRNLLASILIWDKNRNFPLRNRSGGISKSSKRTITASRSTLALSLAMCGSETSPSTSGDSNSSSLAPPSLINPETALLSDHCPWLICNNVPLLQL